MTAIHTNTQNDLQVLVVHIGNEEYAVGLTAVREVVRTPALTPIPQAAEGIVGMANLRGSVVTVMNLQAILGIKEADSAKPSTHLMIVEHDSELFGLLVNQASEVLRVSNEQLQEAPELLQTHPHANVLQGILILGEESHADQKRMIPLLNIQVLLTDLNSSSVS